MIALVLKQCVLATGICTTFSDVGFTDDTANTTIEGAMLMCESHRDPLRALISKFESPKEVFYVNCESTPKTKRPVLASIIMEVCNTQTNMCIKETMAEYYSKDVIPYCDKYVALNADFLNRQANSVGYRTELKCSKEAQ